MVSSTFFPLFLLSTLLVPSQADSLSPKRATYNGGWPLGLAGPTCPSEAPVSCQDLAKAVNPTCCPTGQTCFGYLSPYCCPTSTDCGNVVTNLPVCANNTWNMYQMAPGVSVFICCEPGTVCVIPIAGDAGICEPPDADTPSSRLAPLASQIGGPAVTRVATATVGNVGVSPTTAPGAGNGQTATISTSTPTNTATAGSGSGSGDIYTSSGSPMNVHFSPDELGGIAIGGAAVLGLIAALIICYCCRRKSGQTKYVEPYRRAVYDGSGLQVGGNPTEMLYAPAPMLQSHVKSCGITRDRESIHGKD